MAGVCENCGVAIGKLETAHVWGESVVCTACHRKLSPDGTGAAGPMIAHRASCTKEVSLYECGHHWVYFLFLRPGVIIFSILTLGLMLIYYALAFNSTKFIITNKRVMKRWGIASWDSSELMIRQVSGVYVNRGLLDRVFGTGQVMVQSAGGVSEAFLAIHRPKEFQQRLIDAMPQ